MFDCNFKKYIVKLLQLFNFGLGLYHVCPNYAAFHIIKYLLSLFL